MTLKVYLFSNGQLRLDFPEALPNQAIEKLDLKNFFNKIFFSTCLNFLRPLQVSELMH